MRRVKAIVSGRVQGVSFRAATAHEARGLRLTGWVRNMPDGAVELEAQGDPGAIVALLAWCAHGPPAARVTGVSIDERDVIAGDRGFELRG